MLPSCDALNAMTISGLRCLINLHISLDLKDYMYLVDIEIIKRKYVHKKFAYMHFNKCMQLIINKQFSIVIKIVLLKHIFT